MIEIIDLKKSFSSGTVTPLKGVNLTVEKGTFLSITGPSGTGKSTLLLCTAGLIRPDSGSVIISNRKVTSMKAAEAAAFRNKNVGFVFQLFHLIPYLTAMENVMVPLFLQNMSSSRQQETAMSLLERVGMSHRAKHRPAQMSAGEQQRISIARAIAVNPEVIFADEPTGNLDKETGQNIIRLLTEISQDNKIVFMVTHDMDAASQGTAQYRLSDGQLEPVHV